jgi:glycosyltransferase involved in cell wall biosynthesis
LIFKFYKYVSPVWYFNLKPQKDANYFPTRQQLQAMGIQMEVDSGFLSTAAQARDLGFRAFQRGLIAKASNKAPGYDIWHSENIPPIDEYRFLRKNFSPVWSLYVLVIRLLSFHNPFREIPAFLKNRNVKRVLYHLEHVEQPDLETFDSPLLQSRPFVSVVIPTLNRYVYLKDVFKDLEKQTYTNFEVIVVDQTDPFDENVYKGWNLDLKYWYQKEKALWKARNDAIKSAKGQFILLYDDDSLVDANWIEIHLKALDYYQVDLSSGVSISTIGAKVPEHYSYFRWSDQLDTGNVLLKREIFDDIGLFDTKFEKQRMGDGEYGLRAYLAGYRNISNPLAKRIHLKVGEGGLRQMGSWDGWRPKKFFGPRPVPSILYLYRKYFGPKLTRWQLLKAVPPSVVPYQFKGSKALMVVGSLVSLLMAPLVLWQVWKSWRLASRFF